MRSHRVFIRNIEAANHLESFLISAVFAILSIRLFLALTGHPQLGGSKLHIAHMLWGGLLMLVSIFILLTFLSKMAHHLAAAIGGIGFGTFIDEVGKFVTHDNDYFFQPSVAIIYVIFVAIFLTVRSIQSGRQYSHQEYLMNAIQELEEVALHDLDEDEKAQALYFLNKSGSKEPLALALKQMLERTDLVPLSSPGFYPRCKQLIRDFYRRMVYARWFYAFLILFFLIQLMIKLSYVIVLIFFKGLHWNQILSVGMFPRIVDQMEDLAFAGWTELGSSLLSGVFVFLGISFIRRSRSLAYRMFERSILVSIFLTQVFAFYREQFGALVGLLLNLLILGTLRIMIYRELSETMVKSKVL